MSDSPLRGTEGGLAQRLHTHLEQRRRAMVDLLARLVATESPSLVPESLHAVQAILTDAFSEAGYQVRRIPGEATGGQLVAAPPERRGLATPDGGPREPFQLLVGHCDTVWPLGTVEHMPVVVEDGRLRGPGSFDMKGGLVQIVSALAALHDLELEPEVMPVVFINSDEEIGSPESRPHLERLAARADRALIIEPALGPTGLIKTARKGIGRYTLRVRARAVPSVPDPEAGSAAILTLARLVERLYELGAPDEGVTINVGVIRGGSPSSLHPDEARAEIDVRVRTRAQAETVDEALRHLSAPIDGVEVEITGMREAPPLERTPRNRRLWETVRRAGADLGLELQETAAGGASDGNTTSLFTATVDGMGTLGDGAHAEHEFVDTRTMPERAALLALVLLKPPLSGAQAP